MRWRRLAGPTCAFYLVTGSAFAATPSKTPADVLIANRLTWGVDAATLGDIRAVGLSRWTERQLHWTGDAPLPDLVQAQLASMRISREPMAALVVQEEAANRAANALTDPDAKKLAQQAYQRGMGNLAREAQERSLLRDLYAPDQLREQMTWFWFNHFNVQAQKRDIRAMVGDYEEQAVRGHALGKFRDLLEATLRHPAMLRYLDNDQNAVRHINENYARELMELHTMGVGSGYTQKDVQELARILTGVGISTRAEPPKLKPDWQKLYVRDGLFEFNPARHDFGDKEFLGHTIKGSGFPEVEQALDLLAASPATAQHVSERLATFFTGDSPSPALVGRMTKSFRSSHGDIPAVLKAMIRSPEFSASLGKGFKDPMHYAVSAVRLAYGDRVVVNADPMIAWLSRMGESLYGHETPDGYALGSAAWTGPGQMNTRFEIARQIGAGAGALFRPATTTAVGGSPAVAPSMAGAVGGSALITPSPIPAQAPVLPQLRDGLLQAGFAASLQPATSEALGQARSPQEWNILFLSSPDFMFR